MINNNESSGSKFSSRIFFRFLFQVEKKTRKKEIWVLNAYNMMERERREGKIEEKKTEKFH